MIGPNWILTVEPIQQVCFSAGGQTVHTTKAPASPWVIGRAHFYRKAEMKTLMAGILILSLTGCASPPRWLAAHFDAMDPCQNPKSMPTWCGASAGRTLIYSTPHQQPLGAQIGYTKNR